MKIRYFLLVLVLLAPLSAWGDQKTDLAAEFMELSRVNRLMDHVKDQVLQFQDQVMAQMEIPENKKEQATAFQQQVHDKVMEVMDFEEMRNEHIQLFANMYTVDELKEMVRFFKSAAGQSMLEKQPAAIQQALEISQSRVGMLIPELQKMSAEFEQSLKTE